MRQICCASYHTSSQYNGLCRQFWYVSLYILQTMIQVQATAEVLSRPDVHSRADRFNFRQYMANRAELVNEALEASVPLQYPEDVVESMR